LLLLLLLLLFSSQSLLREGETDAINRIKGHHKANLEEEDSEKEALHRGRAARMIRDQRCTRVRSKSSRSNLFLLVDTTPAATLPPNGKRMSLVHKVISRSTKTEKKKPECSGPWPSPHGHLKDYHRI